MTDIIIPIKDLPCAKQRLTSVLAPSERAELVLAMLEDLLSITTELDQGNIWLVSSDERVFDIARKYAARPILEDKARGYNEAVSLGLSAVPTDSDVAVLPGDIPMATSAEIAALIAPSYRNNPTIRFAAAHDQLGTNGLFLSKNDLIHPAFGPNSFVGHLQSAREAEIEPTILDAPGMARDIDTPTDLHNFVQHSNQSRAHSYLQMLSSNRLIQFSVKGAA